MATRLLAAIRCSQADRNSPAGLVFGDPGPAATLTSCAHCGPVEDHQSEGLLENISRAKSVGPDTCMQSVD